jgi:tetratricopeptide (TPR) repeat protein
MTHFAESALPFNKYNYQEQLTHTWDSTLSRFNRYIKSLLFFKLAFLLILTFELISFLAFLAIFKASSYLAFLLATFFLTLFCFFVLRLYFQAKKPEKLSQFVEEYIEKCKRALNFQEQIAEHHIALASALQKFAANLYEKEYCYYTPPAFLKSLAPTLEKYSCFCHWEDIHQLKELLLTKAAEEHLKVVKIEPTNLEVHAALANAYVMLSSLYADPRKYHGFDDTRWISPKRYSPKMQERFRILSERAIEEFKILNDYAPDDPWVHMQLAYSYHDLQMPEEEMREYEVVLKLSPGDKETLFKLGMLYFNEGKNAKGLQIYEILKRTHYKKAERLIKFYGCFE